MTASRLHLTFNKIWRNFLFLGVLISLVAACTTDDIVADSNRPVVDGSNPSDGLVHISIKVPQGFQVPTTRTVAAADIEDFYLLIFSGPNKDQRVLTQVEFFSTNPANSETELLSEGETDKEGDKIYTFSVQLEEGNYDFVALANLNDVVSLAESDVTMDSSLWKSWFEENIDKTSLEGFIKSLQIKRINDEKYWHLSPMSGMSRAIEIYYSQTSNVSIDLHRSIATVNLNLSAGVASNYKIKSVNLYNTYTKGFLTPDLKDNGFNLDQPHIIQLARKTTDDDENIEADNSFKKIVTNHEFKPNDSEASIDAIFTDNKVQDVIYLMESNPGGAASLKENTCLVVGLAKDDESVRYYRIDFQTSVKETAQLVYLPILRNHIYNFTIKEIKDNATAYESATAAYEAGPQHSNSLGVDLFEYDLSDIGNVVFNGRNFLAANPTEKIHSINENDGFFEVLTNYQTNEARPKIELLMLDNETSSLIPFEGDWLISDDSHAVAQELDETDQLGGAPVQRYKILYDLNTNSLEDYRVAYIRVTIGVLSIDVRIEQESSIGFDIAIEAKNSFGEWEAIQKLDFVRFSSSAASSDYEEQTYRIKWKPATANLDISFTSHIQGTSATDATELLWHDFKDVTSSSNPKEVVTDESKLYYEDDWICADYRIKPDIGSALGEERIFISLSDQSGASLIKTLLLTVQTVSLDMRQKEPYVLLDGSVVQVEIYSTTDWQVRALNYKPDQEMLALKQCDKDTPLFTSVELNGKTTLFKKNSDIEAVGGVIAEGVPGKHILNITTADDMGDPKLFYGDLKVVLEPKSAKSNESKELSVRLASVFNQKGKEANCYILNPYTGAGILIPVRAAKRVIMDQGKKLDPVKNIPFNEASSDELKDFEPKLLWTSRPASAEQGVGKGGAIRLLKAVGSDEKGYILVMPNKKAPPSKSTKYDGNSLIAVTNTQGNKILWSWHIWSTDAFGNILMSKYIPPKFPGDRKGWLDRDLGALSTIGGKTGTLYPIGDKVDADSYGYYYQWGRKDPTPSPNVKRKKSGAAERQLFDAEGQALEVKLVTPHTQPDVKAPNLNEVLNNPLNFYVFESGNKRDTQNKKWTSNEANNFWDATTKTIYDPCPAGYRVAGTAKSDRWLTQYSWGGWLENPAWTHIGEIGDFLLGKTYGGYTYGSGKNRIWFSGSGYRYIKDYDSSTTTTLDQVGEEGYRWTSLLHQKRAQANQPPYAVKMSKSVLEAPGAGIVPGGLPPSNRASGYPVRCVRVE